MSDVASAQTKTARNKSSHRSKYYIPVTREGNEHNIVTESGLSISYNPPGDGSCPFAAITNHLATLGIHRSARSLRQEVIKYLEIHVVLGNSEQAVPWVIFIEEPRMQYLRRMNLNEQVGDHITLQMIVVSTLTHGTTLIRPDGSSQVTYGQACFVLGHNLCTSVTGSIVCA